MQTDSLLHIIGEKASYRIFDGGIKFYIRSSSRSDQQLLKKLRNRSGIILTIAVISCAPLFFAINPMLKWSVFLFAGLLWSVWVHSYFIYLLKKYGVETLAIRKNQISYRKYLNHRLMAVQLSHAVKELPVGISTEADIVRYNSLFPEKRIITSYLKLISHGKNSYLVFNPILKEKDEVKNILHNYL